MTTPLEPKCRLNRKRANDIRLAAHILDILLRRDRQVRPIRAARNRQEWSINRLNDYLHAIGVEIATDGDTALWRALHDTVSLLPQRREEGLIRLARLWGRSGGWLADQAIARPLKPPGYDRLSAPRIYSAHDGPPAA
jgi:hypothetical protein